MKNRLFIFIVIALIVFLTGRIEAATDTGKIDAKIKLAADYLLDPEGPGEKVETGFKLLLEAIVMSAPDTEFPAAFGEKMSEAKKLFDSTAIFNEKGITLLNESYNLINSGEEFQMPDSISSIEDAVEYARKQLDAAREYLKQGKTGKCVNILTEIAIMIVTPVERIPY